ncbi:MAG TPA: hypothetical protein PK736_06240 [Bacteroidia bacterium]|nr:hypothetical protein [Bacteroidia bacterium]
MAHCIIISGENHQLIKATNRKDVKKPFFKNIVDPKAFITVTLYGFTTCYIR